jgi:tetratricopeptide (TPR) repeat protein
MAAKLDDTVLGVINATQVHDLTRALAILRAHPGTLNTLSASHEACAALADSVARLLERDTSHLLGLKRLLTQWDRSDRSTVRLVDLTHWEIARGLVALEEQRFDEGEDHLRLATSLGMRAKDPMLAAFPQFYLARCLYLRGVYGEALELTIEARDRVPPRYRRVRGTMILMEAWIHFRLGRQDRAERLLEQAIDALPNTGDHIEKSNVLSFRARIARQRGEYELSVRLLQEAIALHDRSGDKSGAAWARCYTNLAFSALLQGRDLEERKRHPNVIEAIRQLRQLAHRSLVEAERLSHECEGRQRLRSLSRVYLYRSELLFDTGKPLEALEQAKAAEYCAEEARFEPTVVHAIISQCRFSPDVLIERAHETLRRADQTEDRRLGCRARICLATLLLRVSYSNHAEAEQLFRAAHSRMLSTDRDYLRTELESLQLDLQVAHDHNAPLCEISAFTVRLKGLQGTLDWIEEAIIERALQWEGENLSRTAEVLGTTRNRIKRILSRAPHTTSSAQSAVVSVSSHQ